MDLTETIITKSTVDLETVPLSENETDSESESVSSSNEDSLNYDDEPVPEYDVE